MNHREVIDVIRELALSNGSYGRLLYFIVEKPEA